MHLLKKYANRRLYDTTTSSYVTIEDVQNLILQFETVKVVDASTDEDITEQILLSVISLIESQKSHQKIFTKALLEQLIRMYSYDYSNNSPLSHFLENSLRFYDESTQKVPMPMDFWSNMAQQQYGIWQKAFGFGMPPQSESNKTKESNEDNNDGPGNKEG